ncbi:acyl-CoA dehydrogenase/oxidase [Lobosporangium transversale]|uniref:Acyl-coenzyme A oxidase n=1 Tax=Lobosporangium transversale TaxID=64571 RepID=A0A1Y2GJY3_9FUNG|nr:acyl-CoA dehydrogenase/oxidase [Lobosporangium transversale]ORZ12957.1 acyl-CoA dehydrogenase/oxidase [Lobosporangium transversale]|eukprot:XP_021880306.1 acyl-CoA dehydrogenase/oxidase [Lobosporangium transversale]
MAESQNKKDLAHARSKVSFKIADMTNYLYGGAANVEHRRHLISLIANDPVFNKDDWGWLNHTDAVKRGIAMSTRLAELMMEHELNDLDFATIVEAIDDPLPIVLHNGAFIPVINSQGTDEQIEKWIPPAEKFQIIGCYAQTELGHGSNLSKLETTATFIKETDEWEINSTTFTAAKWWIGGLGALCTHAVVQARLFIDGKDYGAHVFVVPLRSLEDHKPFPGIQIGDIGPKAYNGFNKMDNGFARFTKYRIPRENMLMRFSKVSRDGVYTKPPHAKLSYGSMVLLRSVLIKQMALYLSRATTVATRYLTVRRQFNNPTSRSADDPHPELETQVINYPMVQNRLFPMIAQAYALFAAGSCMMDMYINLMTGLSSGKIDALAEVHAMSSALKSYCTTIGAAGTEESRKLMGGHGFSYFTGLAHLFASIVPSNTYEGDNYVLTQQMARYLLKEIKTARATPDKVTPFSRYLLLGLNKNALERTTCAVAQPEDWLKPEIQLAAFEHRCARLAFELSDAVDQAGEDLANVKTWSDHNIECYRISHAHAQYTMVLWFIQAIRDAQDPETDPEHRAEPASIKVLERLSNLHALHTIQTNLADFAEDGYLSPAQCQSLRAQVKALVASLADDAVGLVDAFDHPDYLLNSALGASDGDAFKRLWDKAQTEPLNKRGVCDGYEEYIRPLLKKHGEFKL